MQIFIYLSVMNVYDKIEVNNLIESITSDESDFFDVAKASRLIALVPVVPEREVRKLYYIGKAFRGVFRGIVQRLVMFRSIKKKNRN